MAVEIPCIVRPGATITRDENGRWLLDFAIMTGIATPYVAVPGDSFDLVTLGSGQMVVDSCYVEFKGDEPTAGQITVYIGTSEATKKVWMVIDPTNMPSP